MSLEHPPEELRTISAALDHFRAHGGMLRTRDALEAGIHPRTLYALRDSGRIELLSRGLYRLVDAPSLGNPDLVTVALKMPNGVLCLISALAWHELTTQIPTKSASPFPEDRNRRDCPIRRCGISGSAAPLIRKESKRTRSTESPFASTAVRKRWRTASSTGIESASTPSWKRSRHTATKAASTSSRFFITRKSVG